MNVSSNQIVIITQATYDIYREFYIFTLFRGPLYKYGPVLFYITSIVGISISLFSGLSFGFDAIIVTLLIVLLVMILLMSFLIFISPKIYYKSGRKLIELPSKYTFTDTFISVESQSEAASSLSKIAYSSIHSIYETNTTIYIFLSNTQAYILPKKDILDLRMIFANRVKKFRNYSR